MITDPIKALIVVLYRPLADFVEELDMLLSALLDDGTPLILLGDFNIHLEGTQAVDFLVFSDFLRPEAAQHTGDPQGRKTARPHPDMQLYH